MNSKATGTKLCPLCEKNINEPEYNTHLCTCYKFGDDGTLLKLPEEGATIKLKNYKYNLE